MEQKCCRMELYLRGVMFNQDVAVNIGSLRLDCFWTLGERVA